MTMPPIAMAARLTKTLHIAMVAWRTTMLGNTVTVQQTTMLHIAKVARQKTATPIAIVVWQTTLPCIPVAVRLKIVESATMALGLPLRLDKRLF
jgi:hypothetical protein